MSQAEQIFLLCASIAADEERARGDKSRSYGFATGCEEEIQREFGGAEAASLIRERIAAAQKIYAEDGSLSTTNGLTLFETLIAALKKADDTLEQHRFLEHCAGEDQDVLETLAVIRSALEKSKEP